MTTINMMIDECSMGDTTKTATAAFITELKNALKTEFPDFDVTIKIGSHSDLHVNLLDSEETKQRVYEIQRDIWDNGAWHNVE